MTDLPLTLARYDIPNSKNYVTLRLMANNTKNEGYFLAFAISYHDVTSTPVSTANVEAYTDISVAMTAYNFRVSSKNPKMYSGYYQDVEQIKMQWLPITRKHAIELCNAMENLAVWDKCGPAYYKLRGLLSRMWKLDVDDKVDYSAVKRHQEQNEIELASARRLAKAMNMDPDSF